MKKCSIFVRGQVWYWNDPIYGDKVNNIYVDKGECTLRYSRYVIIAQTTKSIRRNKGILVIPCSSKRSDPSDVELLLAHPTCFSKSFAKVNMVFPISPSFLDRYICTLPDESLKEIDKYLSKLLLSDVDEDDEYDEADEQGTDDEEEYNEENVDTSDGEDIMDTPVDGDVQIIVDVPPVIDTPVIKDVSDCADEVTVYESYNGGIVFDTIIPSSSKFSHMIIKYMRTERVFNTIDHKHAKSKTSVNAFYSDLDSIIFKSLLNFLDVKTEDGNVHPEIDVTDPKINTWLFLSRIYNDRRISHERNDPILIVNQYRNYYEDGIINHEWSDELQKQLELKMKLNQNQIQYIMSMIRDYFCQPR